jgi:hypothetical protein
VWESVEDVEMLFRQKVHGHESAFRWRINSLVVMD